MTDEVERGAVRSYRITGLDEKGKRRILTTARSRKEAVHVARRVKAEGNFRDVRIEPTRELRAFAEMDRDAAARKSAAKRGKIG